MHEVSVREGVGSDDDEVMAPDDSTYVPYTQEDRDADERAERFRDPNMLDMELRKAYLCLRESLSMLANKASMKVLVVAIEQISFDRIQVYFLIHETVVFCHSIARSRIIACRLFLV
jgi:hypothetical protein